MINVGNIKELPYLAKIALIFLGLTVVTGVAYYIYLAPLAKQNEADELTLRAKQAEVAQLSPYRARLADLTRQNEQLLVQMEEQRKIVPEEKDVPSFLTMVQQQAMASGIEIRRYTPKDVATRDYYVEVPFEVDIDGGYFAVTNFFRHLQTVDRIIGVSHMTLGSLKNGKTGTRRGYTWAPHETVGANCVLTTYYSNSHTGPATPVKKK